MSVCTHRVQQKQRLIHLIYTMHRVLFTWDIPTEGLNLVFLAFQTRQTHFLSLSLSCARALVSATKPKHDSATRRTYLISNLWLLLIFTCLHRFHRVTASSANDSNLKSCWKSLLHKTCQVYLSNIYQSEKRRWFSPFNPQLQRQDWTGTKTAGLYTQTSHVTQLSTQHRIHLKDDVI